jgi:hypothetical protein
VMTSYKQLRKDYCLPACDTVCIYASDGLPAVISTTLHGLMETTLSCIPAVGRDSDRMQRGWFVNVLVLTHSGTG